MNVPVIVGGLAWGPISGPNLQAVDGTGLLAGPLEEGVGFIDTTVFRTGNVGSQFMNGYLTPATGPTSGGTQLTVTEPAAFSALSAVYFGSRGATKVSAVSGPNTYGNFGSITATTPPGAAGPADFFVFTSDGGMQFVPEGFSCGPSILEVTPNMSTAEGGGIGIIYGYGFGPVGSGVPGPLPQAQAAVSNVASVQVTVGGTPVQVTGFAPYAYPTQSPPFPLQALAFTIPPGTAPADITVAGSNGTATVHAAVTYLPPVQSFPLPGSALAQGVYDSYRDVYYFTDVNRIQVFSRTQRAWLAPISIPAPQGTAQRLWGIALSPNGNKLAVSDLSAAVIYVLDLASPGSVRTFAVNAQNVGFEFPTGVAISDSGTVYYTVMWKEISGGRGFFKLDTKTGQILDYNIGGPGGPADVYLRVAISSDNSRVFFNDDGWPFYVDTATDKFYGATVDPACCYGDYELSLAADQGTVAATGYLYDSSLNAQAVYAMNVREALT